MHSACPHLRATSVELRLLPRGAYSVRYTPSRPVVGFAFESQGGVHAFGSDRVRAFRAPAHGLAFTPAGCSVFSEAAEGGEYLTLSGDPEALAALCGDEDGARGVPQQQFTGRIWPGSVRAAYALRRLLLSGNADPPRENRRWRGCWAPSTPLPRTPGRTSAPPGPSPPEG